MDECEAIVRKSAKKLGYPELKEEQLRVVVAFMNGRDVFAVLPTGYGKSLCYACLPYAFDMILRRDQSIVVVATPLTAIMKDQVGKFSSMGLSTALVIGEDDDEHVKSNVEKGEYQLVFFTPELLIDNKRWRKMLLSDTYVSRLKAFVVDEAHCVRKWGSTFRTALNRIGEVRSILPSGVNVMALTATASKSLRFSVTL